MTYLNVNTTHLERKVLKASFGELFKNQYSVERNHGTVFGTPVIDYGAVLNGTTDYIRYALIGHEFDSANISIVIEFWPNFAADEDADRFFFNNNAADYYIRRRPAAGENKLRIALGNTVIADVLLATYSPYWNVGERNILIVSGTSGDTSAWLNANNILNKDSTAWTPVNIPDITVGATGGGSAGFFDGKITDFKIFKSLLTQQDAINYFNNTTEILPPPTIHLPMFSGDHVPSNKTLDISVNGYDADFGAGAAEPVKNVARGYRVDAGQRFAIDEPGIGAQTVSVSFRIKDMTLDPAGSYLWDARRTGGTGYCYINTSGNLVVSSGTPYVNGRPTNVVNLYDSVITITGHLIDVTEGLDLCVKYDYHGAVDLNADVLEFEMSPETLTHVKVSKIYERMTRRVPTQQANLCSETMPAERMRGASFASRFVNQLQVEALDGIVYGTPVIDFGAILNGTTDYIVYELKGHEFNSAKISIKIDFWPDFETGEDVQRYLFNTTIGSRYLVVKRENGFAVSNGLVVRLGDTVVGQIAEAGYAPYWKVGERNQLIISSNGSNTKIRLNTNLILDSSVAWTVANPSELFIGSNYTGANLFNGKITDFKVFKSLLTQQDAINYYDNTMFDYRKRAVIDLPMLDAQHDPSNSRTLDVSRNIKHAQFGVGAAEPTKNTKRGYYFDGGDHLKTVDNLAPDTGFLTMACICKLDTVGRQSLFYLGESNTNIGGLLQFVPTSQHFAFYCGGGTVNNRANSPEQGLASGHVHTVIGVYDGTNTKIYVDGKAGVDAFTPLAPDLDSAMAGFVGDIGNFSQGTVGDILECVAFTEPLSPIQAADLHIYLKTLINQV